MAINPKTERKRLRLAEYDYTSAGYYYVTLCTQGRLSLFGEILNERMHLNEAGKMVNDVWVNLPKHFPDLKLDTYVVMPNHFHGIVIIDFGTAQRPSPTKSLSDIIKSFKSYTTKKYVEGIRKKNWLAFDIRLWQRSFYEHIIRCEESLLEIKQYIMDNPLKWNSDSENPHVF